jgi:thiamine-phosphate pyrophosphorylase
MQPVICLITDRRRFAAPAGQVVAAEVRAAARAGVHLVQVRERDLDGGALLALVRDCLAAVAGTRTRIVVNDRLDVALAAGAHGVHLRGDSMPAARARHVTPAGFLVGRSVHSVAEARRAADDGGLDYLIFGNVFATASKPGVTAAGAETLGAVASATPLPVLAVGGITLDNLQAVAQAGAAGFAAIGLFADVVPGDIAAVVAKARTAFDSIDSVP